jgi:hypothetical protein
MSDLTIPMPIKALRYAQYALPSSLSVGPEAAQTLTELLMSAEGPALDRFIALLTTRYQEEASHLSRFQKSAIIRFIAELGERREEVSADIAHESKQMKRMKPSSFHRMGFLPHLLPK